MLAIRTVRTRDELVNGVIQKFEIVDWQDSEAFEPLSSHYTEPEAVREAETLGELYVFLL